MPQRAETARTIAVTGSGTVSVRPEIARISFGIETTASEMAEANTTHQERAKALLLSLSNYDVASTYFYSYPIYNYENEKRVTGYEITSTYELVTENLGEIDKITDIILFSGGAYINSVEFALKDNSATYATALSKALENAKAKATALIADNKELRIKKISEQNYFYSPCRMSYSDYMCAETGDIATLELLSGEIGETKSIIYKDIEINANIDVEFIVI